MSDLERIKQEIEQLKREIAKHDEAYHTYDTPLISDEKYDLLRKKIRKISTRFSAIF